MTLYRFIVLYRFFIVLYRSIVGLTLYRYELKQPLKSLGITRMFKNPRYPGGAELGAFCASQDPNRRLFITDALHNAYLEVNEEGTEAAAVTIFAPEAAAALPEMVPFTPVFRADKPFLFLILHRKTNAILFMGRVVVPIVEELRQRRGLPLKREYLGELFPTTK